MKQNFGKLVSYKQNGNEIEINFEKQTAYVTVVKNDIIRVMVPFFSKECKSKAIESEVCVTTPFSVEHKADALVIATDKMYVQVADDFVVDFYKADGELLVADYRGERTIQKKVSWETVEMLEAEGHDTSSLVEDEVCYQIVKQLDAGDDF